VNARSRNVSPPVSNSLREYARGVAGGLMFSLPLLYTMEVWRTGFVAEPMRLLIYVAATFVLLLGYNHYAGLHEDACWSEVVIDSVEEMGLGLLVAAGVLFLLGHLETDMSAYEIVGKITVEAMTVGIGISVGTSQLRGDDERAKGGAEASAKAEVTFGGQIVIAFCGAMLFAANVAPDRGNHHDCDRSSNPQRAWTRCALACAHRADPLLHRVHWLRALCSGERNRVRRCGHGHHLCGSAGGLGRGPLLLRALRRRGAEHLPRANDRP